MIPGINFTPRETVRERYDLTGLTKHLARMCALSERYMYVGRKNQRIINIAITALINLGSKAENENLRSKVLSAMNRS